jgi:hypothetical protein
MIRLKTFWVPVFYLRAWKTDFIQWLNNYFSGTSSTTTDTDIRRHLKYAKEIVKLRRGMRAQLSITLFSFCGMPAQWLSSAPSKVRNNINDTRPIHRFSGGLG